MRSDVLEYSGDAGKILLAEEPIADDADRDLERLRRRHGDRDGHRQLRVNIGERVRLKGELEHSGTGEDAGSLHGFHIARWKAVVASGEHTHGKTLGRRGADAAGAGQMDYLR